MNHVIMYTKNEIVKSTFGGVDRGKHLSSDTKLTPPLFNKWSLPRITSRTQASFSHLPHYLGL